jgi:hypothetical protein
MPLGLGRRRKGVFQGHSGQHGRAFMTLRQKCECEKACSLLSNWYSQSMPWGGGREKERMGKGKKGERSAMPY